MRASWVRHSAEITTEILGQAARRDRLIHLEQSQVPTRKSGRETCIVKSPVSMRKGGRRGWRSSRLPYTVEPPPGQEGSSKTTECFNDITHQDPSREFLILGSRRRSTLQQRTCSLDRYLVGVSLTPGRGPPFAVRQEDTLSPPLTQPPRLNLPVAIAAAPPQSAHRA